MAQCYLAKYIVFTLVPKQTCTTIKNTPIHSRQHETSDGSLRTLKEQRGKVVKTGPGDVVFQRAQKEKKKKKNCALLIINFPFQAPGSS